MILFMVSCGISLINQPTISLEMPVPSQGHYGFHSFQHPSMPLHMKLHKIIYLRSTNNSVFVYVENEYYNLCGKWLAYFKLIIRVITKLPNSEQSYKRKVVSFCHHFTSVLCSSSVSLCSILMQICSTSRTKRDRGDPCEREIHICSNEGDIPPGNASEESKCEIRQI
jgi:hypothetical protein